MTLNLTESKAAANKSYALVAIAADKCRLSQNYEFQKPENTIDNYNFDFPNFRNGTDKLWLE